MGSINSISFTISGGWDGDYTIVLSHTDGTASQSVTLLSSLLGGAAANSGFNVTISSTGSGSINGAGTAYNVSTAAITGTYGTSDSGINFSSFSGASAGGDWLLYVTDNHSGDQGMLTGWSLSMDAVPEPINVALGVFGALALIISLARSQKVKQLFVPQKHV